MIVNQEVNPNGVLAFAHIEKTAGTTISRILRSEFGLRHCDVKPILDKAHSNGIFSAKDFELVKKFYPGIRSIAGHSLKPYGDLWEKHPDIQFYTFLRDPVKRLISLYQHRILKNGQSYSFEQFLNENAHLKNWQSRFISGAEDASACIKIFEERFIYVGITEEFSHSWGMLSQMAGFKTIYTDFNASFNASSDSSIKQEIFADPFLVKLAQEFSEEDHYLYQHVAEGFEDEKSKLAHTNRTKVFQNSDVFNLRYYLNKGYYYGVYRMYIKLSRLMTNAHDD